MKPWVSWHVLLPDDYAWEGKHVRREKGNTLVSMAFRSHLASGRRHHRTDGAIGCRCAWPGADDRGSAAHPDRGRGRHRRATAHFWFPAGGAGLLLVGDRCHDLGKQHGESVLNVYLCRPGDVHSQHAHLLTMFTVANAK